MKIEFDWEILDRTSGRSSIIHTHRAKVFGGWIIRSFWFDKNTTPSQSQSTVFIPDPNHEWEIK